ncbi:MAG: hypothetical protein JXR75_00240 [Rhodobacteraceae bacterium]|nr:hypothetical protein [Paracoccaceae bacterium]
MQFIVYSATPYTGTQHLILRSGDAPEAQISIQASAGEVAIAAPVGWVMPASGTWLYDASNQQITLLSVPQAPGGTPIGTYGLEEIKARVRRDLRRSDWTQLSDAPLTAQQKQDYAVYRAYLRGAVAALTTSSTSGELISGEVGPPGPLDEPL